MVRIIVTVLLVAATVVPAHAERGNVLITGESLGRIRIGATRDAVLRAYRDHRIMEIDLRHGGQPSPALRIVREGHALVTAELAGDGTVQRLWTTNATFRTRDRIKVGSPMRRVEAVHGAPEIVILDGRVVAVYPVHGGAIGFEFDVPASPAPDRIAPDREVTRILVLGRTNRPS